MGTLLQDLRYGARMLWHNPGFTLVAVLALALGIGATSAIFTVVDAMLLRPLPFAEPEQLVGLRSALSFDIGATSYPDYADFRARNHVLSDVATWRGVQAALTGSGDAVHLNAIAATPNLLRTLRVTPAFGRSFADDEGHAGNRLVMVAYDLWQSRFGADPSLVGRTIELDGQAHTVVGILPRSFKFPLEKGEPEAQLLFSFPRDEDDARLTQERSRGSHFLSVVARMKPGVSVAQARADMDAVAASMRVDHPDESGDKSLTVTTRALQAQVVEEVRAPLFLLLAAVVAVLLIACANVANLLLARATTRQREIAIRAALGASRGRIARQMLTESALLGLVGGGAGVLLALWLVDGLMALAHDSLPHLNDVALDGRVLLFTLAVALVTSAGFGLWPALHASRIDLNAALKETARATAHARSRRARSGLLVAEIAIALILLAGAGLALRSFSRLTHVDPGFRSDGLTIAQLDLPNPRYTKREDQERYYQRALAELRSLPGAQSVALAWPLPFSNSDIRLGVHLPGQPPNPRLDSPGAALVSPSYFATMGIPLLRGRTFADAEDRPDAPRKLVVSEGFARRLFPSEDPIGKHVVMGLGNNDYEIIGVVGEVRAVTLNKEIVPMMYAPMGNRLLGAIGVVVRSAAPRALMPTLRAALLRLDRDLPPPLLETMNDALADNVEAERVVLTLLALFAAIAVILTCVGIYGVTAYTVTQRTREIGIRVALGATDGTVVAMIVGEGVRLSLWAIALGLGGALALGRLASTLFFGVGAVDLVTLIPVVLLVLLVTLLACLIPARRAARVDPMVALRYE
jgi:putative ABC transport system permease protein